MAGHINKTHSGASRFYSPYCPLNRAQRERSASIAFRASAIPGKPGALRFGGSVSRVLHFLLLASAGHGLGQYVLGHAFGLELHT